MQLACAWFSRTRGHHRHRSGLCDFYVQESIIPAKGDALKQSAISLIASCLYARERQHLNTYSPIIKLFKLLITKCGLKWCHLVHNLRTSSSCLVYFIHHTVLCYENHSLNLIKYLRLVSISLCKKTVGKVQPLVNPTGPASKDQENNPVRAARLMCK